MKVINILQKHGEILPKESYKKTPVFKQKYKEIYYTVHPISKQPYYEVPGSFNSITHVVVGSFWYETDEFTGVVKLAWNFVPPKPGFKQLGVVKSHRRRRGF